MKKITLSLVMITITITVIAQSPQAFKYQTVVRDNAGEILANQDVSFQISILEGSTTGTAIYMETHDTITNDHGLVSLEIGNGNVVSGVFTDIDWGGDSYFLQIELDEDGGTEYQLMGTTQLLAVPYSLYSETTGDTTRWRKNNGDLYYNVGNVGIGTDSPDPWSQLDIRGNDPDNGAVFNIGNSDNSHMLKLFGGHNNDPNPFLLWKEGDPLRFSTDEGGWSEKMRITSNGRLGIGTSAPAAGLHVEDTIGVLFTGKYEEGEIPIEGDGIRMMWYPAKAAFRVGYVNASRWDDPFIGNCSVAMGLSTIADGFSSFAIGNGSWAASGNSTAMGTATSATGVSSTAMGFASVASGENSTAMGNGSEASGESSIAMGNSTTASGNFSTAMGDGTTASGWFSTAMGLNTEASFGSATAMGHLTIASGESSTAMGSHTEASGFYSTAMGFDNKAIGVTSTAMGNHTVAESFASFAMGRYNVGGGDPFSWVTSDPLFEIGIGTSTLDRTNALTVLKNGYVGVGITTPDRKLHILTNTTSEIAKFENLDISSLSDGIVIKAGPPANPTVAYAKFYDGDGTLVGYITGNGVGGVNYGSVSDERLKMNVRDFSGGLKTLSQIQVRNYEMKSAPGNERIGFIAQELQAVYPQAVSGTPDSDVNEKPMMLDYGRITPVLVCAIQEQQEIIKKLEKRIEELEKNSQIK